MGRWKSTLPMSRTRRTLAFSASLHGCSHLRWWCSPSSSSSIIRGPFCACTSARTSETSERLWLLGMRIRPSQGFTSSSHRCCWVQRLSSATCWSGRLGTWGWSCSCLLPGWTMWPQKLPSPKSRFTTLLCYSSQFLWPSSLTASGSSSRLLREIWCTTVNPSA